MKQPEDYKNRVLLVSLGTSPQIITEVIYALTVGREKKGESVFLPSAVVVVSTKSGIAKARNELEDKGHYQRFMDDYTLYPLPKIQYKTIEKDGLPLEDIRTTEDNEAAADTITRIIAEITSDADTALHISLAGGRKTQGYYTGFAASLFCRSQDRLSHVLVTEGFEGNAGFFYTPPKHQAISIQRGAGEYQANAADADIELADLPFVSLRKTIPERYLRDAKEGLSAIIAKIKLAESSYLLTLNLDKKSIYLGGHELDLSNNMRELAFLYMLLSKKISDGEGVFLRPNDKMKRREFDEAKRVNGVAYLKSYLICLGMKPAIIERDIPNTLSFDSDDYELESNNFDEYKVAEVMLENLFNSSPSAPDVSELTFIGKFISDRGMNEKFSDEVASKVRKLIVYEFGKSISDDLLPTKRRAGRFAIALDSERLLIE